MAPPPPPPLPPVPLPVPPPLEAVGVHNKGSWDIIAMGPDNDDFEFFIKPDYSVSEIKSTNPSSPAKVKLQCSSTSPKASVTFDTGFMAKQDLITVQSTQNDAFNIGMVHTFRFDWSSPISGVGQYSSSGQYNVGTEVIPEWENCTGGFSFKLEHFGTVT